MNVALGYSLIYMLSVVALVGGILLYKKTETSLYAAIWIPLVIVLFTCFEAVLAALLNWVFLPANIVTIGLLNYIPAGFFWYQIVRTGQRQKYLLEGIDVAIWLALLAFTAWFVHKRFGGLTLAINYATIDPAAHFKAAMDVVNGQKIENMFHAALNNALIIETFAPFTTVDRYYRIFIMADIGNYLLAGAMFYGAVRRFLTNRYAKCIGGALSMVYVIGYPLSSLMFGFVYLGMGISIVAAIIVLTDSFVKEELQKWFHLILLMLGCAGIFTCYMLFMPITFFAVILCIFRKQWQRKRLISADTVITCLVVFLLPCIIGLFYCYGGLFTKDVSLGSAINNEGACYRDLYSNFIAFLPLALLGYYQTLKEKKNEVIVFLFPFAIVFLAGLFIKGMRLEASSYYFYKNYNLMWLLVFYLAISALPHLQSQTKLLLGCCLTVWAAVFVLYLGNVEEKIKNRSELFCIVPKAGWFNDIFCYNFDTLAIGPRYSQWKLDLYSYVYQELLQEQKTIAVPLVGGWEDEIWYQDITNQRDTAWRDWWDTGEYILVLTDEKSEDYWALQEFFDALTIVYQNDAGYVAQLAH